MYACNSDCVQTIERELHKFERSGCGVDPSASPLCEEPKHWNNNPVDRKYRASLFYIQGDSLN